ncbi:MAG TPA: hypothetical protein VNP95_04325 [Thermomicrobiales bacterium]|nr:hypothetical protein [Thermomicrobiales bacterium]
MTTRNLDAPLSGHLAKRCFASRVLMTMLCSVLLVGGGQTAFAQETPDASLDTPQADGVVATEAPVEEVTEPPTEVIVTEEPVYPTEEPVYPTEEPVIEPTLEPTLPPTEEPTATATEIPTETPSPTPAPSLAYTLAAQPDCQLAPESTTTLAAGASIEYVCTERLSVSGANLSPAGMGIAWSVRIEAEGGWSVQVLPPVNPGETQQWSDPGLATATIAFTPVDPFGADTAPATIETQSEIAYRVRVTRPEGTTCDRSPYALTFTRDAAVTASEATATPGPTPDPYRLTPDLAAIPAPTVSFAGPLDFGDVPLSAESPAGVVKDGTLTVTVNGLDATCGGWTLHLSGAGLTDTDGTPLEGSALVITAIDDAPLAAGECRLADGCDLVTIDGGAGAPTTSTHTIRVELRMPDAPRTGSFRASVQAGLRGDPSTGQE